MLVDVVIDTNVLKHADDPRQDHQPHCAGLIDALLGSETTLAMDAGFSLSESENTSLIGREYLDLLLPGMLGYALLVALADAQRLIAVNAPVHPATRKWLNQRIRTKRDRTFVLVAIATEEKVLASQDFKDFDESKRKAILKKIGVEILIADDCCSLV